jgi:signal transduction histidine kinase
MIEIRDNGRGFLPDHPAGVGTQTMEERAVELNGQLLIEALPGGGTLVQATLPLEAGHE